MTSTNYIDNSQAMYMKYNRELRNVLKEINKAKATFIHVSVHFSKDGPNTVESTAKLKSQQYNEAFKDFKEKVTSGEGHQPLGRSTNACVVWDRMAGF